MTDKKIITEIIPEKAIFNEKMPEFCTDPKMLEKMEVFYERTCEIDPLTNEKKNCKVTKTFVTVGDGDKKKTYEFNRQLSLNQARQAFLQRCDCGGCRDYNIEF